jgi:hypothetical protein
MAMKFWFCDTVTEKCWVSYEQHVFALELAASRWLQIPVTFTGNQLRHILPVVQLGCVLKFLKAWYFRLLFDPMKMFTFLYVLSQFIFKNSINSYLAVFSLKSSLFASSSFFYNGIQNLEFWTYTSAPMHQWICCSICIFAVSEMTAIRFILLKF